MLSDTPKPADGQDFAELAPEQQATFKEAMARAGISPDILTETTPKQDKHEKPNAE